VTDRSDRAGHERKALGHRWRAGLILAGSLECTKAHAVWPVPADEDVMLSVIIKAQCTACPRRSAQAGRRCPARTDGRPRCGSGVLDGKCLASAKHPPMAPSSGTVWWEALAGQAVSSVPRASCRRRWTCGWVLPTANLLGPDLADMLEARPSPAAGRSDARGRQGRAVPNVYVDQRRGALIVVWERRWKGACRPRLRHSMSSVQSRGTRPNRRSPLESCRLPGLRSLAPPSSARHALWAGRELPAVTGRRQPVLTPM